MGEVLPPWPHKPATTETSVRICGKETITVVKKHNYPGRSVRIHGNLILSHGTRRIGPRSSSSVDVSHHHRVQVVLDHRSEDVSPAAFTCIENCSKFIHDMLATKVLAATGEYYDLAAAGNWVESTSTPLDIATAIVQQVRHEYADDVPADLELDVHLPELRVALVYSEPKALLLACKEAAAKETEAAGPLARGRKRRRREPDGELCPVCLLETEEEETVGLPCSHLFHCTCIETWFHRASTCPSCRCDIMECFTSVRAASPKINYDLRRVSQDQLHLSMLHMWNLFGDESEEEPDIAQGEQSITSENVRSTMWYVGPEDEVVEEHVHQHLDASFVRNLFGDESEEEPDIAQGEQSITSENVRSTMWYVGPENEVVEELVQQHLDSSFVRNLLNW